MQERTVLWSVSAVYLPWQIRWAFCLAVAGQCGQAETCCGILHKRLALQEGLEVCPKSLCVGVRKSARIQWGWGWYSHTASLRRSWAGSLGMSSTFVDTAIAIPFELSVSIAETCCRNINIMHIWVFIPKSWNHLSNILNGSKLEAM